MKPGIPSSISLVLVSVVLLLSLFLTVSPPAAKAQAGLPPPATLSVFSEDVFSNNLTNPNLKIGSTFIIDIKADNLAPIVNGTIGGVTAIDIIVNYDSHILKATGIGYATTPGADTPPCPSTDGCLWDGKAVLLFAKKVDSPPGQSELAIAGQGPGNRITGSGILFRILFQIRGTGYTNIAISGLSTITGPLGSKGTAVPLPYTISNGSFDNTPLYILFALPSAGRVLLGGSVATKVTVFMETGGPQNVSLSASGLPVGATASFKPSFGFTTFTSLLNITTPTTTRPGNYTVRVTGLCPGCVNGVDFAQNMNFSLSVNLRNVAVLSVTPSVSAADVGTLIPVSVTVKNKGTEYETFGVNLFANATIAASQSGITLRPGTSQTLSLVWNTTPFRPGSYNVTAQIPPLFGESNVTDNTMAGGKVRLGFPDVGVTSVAATSSVVNLGETVNISIAVANLGLSSQNFTVNAFVSVSGGQKTQVGSLEVASLAPGQATTLTVSWATSGFNAGTYTVRAEIPAIRNETVLANNSLDGNSVLLNAPPTASFIITTTTPTARQAVSFDASQSSDSDGTVTSYGWNFGDGATGIGKTISHVYRTQGTYTVTLTVTDNNGGTKTTTQTLMVANALPTASFTVTTTTPTAGQGVSFDASKSSDSDGTITNYSWDFGDGTTDSGTTVTHKYQTEGTYTVTLTVKDNDGGTNTMSQTVNVAAAPNRASILTSPLGLTGIAAVVVLVILVAVLLARRRGRRNKP